MLKFMLTVIVHLAAALCFCRMALESREGGEGVAIATCEDRPDLALAADSPELITHSYCWREGRGPE